MTEPEVARTVRGRCLCGEVRFEFETPTAFCAHCHCGLCRRAHGAGYVTWVGAARERFRLISGERELVRYRSSPHGERSFCGRCGSSLFCELTTHPGVIDVVLANLEDEIDRPPQLHVHYSDRAPWVRVDDGLLRLGGETGLERIEDGSGPEIDPRRSPAR